jgi:hypothetical protein
VQFLHEWPGNYRRDKKIHKSNSGFHTRAQSLARKFNAFRLSNALEKRTAGNAGNQTILQRVERSSSFNQDIRARLHLFDRLQHACLQDSCAKLGG